MSKLMASFSYKDWCILKHALEDKIKTKEETKIIIEAQISKGKQVLDKKKYSEFLKELEEEKRTLQKVTERTDSFKKYIHGKERFY